MTDVIDVTKLWTAQHCADFLDVAPRTWHAYVKRPNKKNPAPQPVIKIGTTPLWDPESVRVYASKRRRGTKIEI
ncbi:Uncharacterised protein [Mycobacteroides abscessus subsp. abscessus]|nr:Uncharacterised protein [Mycobacteroides abscessus subsp. abscessus]